ncbi:FixH family protein [Alteribacillus iranensis]|uniref:YtkA-like n=1 Tax=Alteribacillus iranensis TaxID=930128 RepID=A0A1I2DGQ1_9BACI|nr:FixH family protein [Alteribacillus iranensis]SFE79792.1 YtkA-like [Alteribacillus iranensis]
MSKSLNFILIVMGALMIFLLSACGESGDNNQAAEDSENSEDVSLEPIEVEIDMVEQADPEEEITISTAVTQSGEPVTDASEVLFEIWKDGGKEDSEEILAEEPAGDIYEIRYSFPEEGVYYVTAHVTARNMHSMPTEEIIVGDPEVAESEEENHPGHEDAHTDSVVEASLQSSEPMAVGEEQELSYEVMYESTPLQGADVQFEVWRDGEEERSWVKAEEKENSIYTGTHTFEEAGDYHVIVHIKNDGGLHEHVEKEVSVE